MLLACDHVSSVRAVRELICRHDEHFKVLSCTRSIFAITLDMSQRKGPQTKTLNRDGSRALHHKAKHDSADFHHFAQEDRVLLRSALLEWYGKNKRDLPWRRPHEKSCQSSLVPEDYPADTQRAYEGMVSHHTQLRQSSLQVCAVWISEIMLQQTQV